MTIEEATPFHANIYVGLRHGYSGEVMPIDEAKAVIQEWVDKVGQCVTVTPTEYVYSKGNEPGFIVGFIDYPRFPIGNEVLRFKVLDLAQILIKKCKQMRISIVFPDKTIMLSNQEEIENYNTK